ncbi:monovalent cation/H+ antiporter complex subunit F [Bacilliculturomica massiliensis]|uniref:monovalent cation/H+ antiporter complex subunit F n=1 Tax=Bacilliculturomica massiliensis TaxID=1917867 RepID=UPI00102F3599|nr:monovalent cation/H+ antiporter complex subunit F [Bacilliculturomica massiliensis]
MIDFLVSYPLIGKCVDLILFMAGLAAVINLVTIARGKTLADRVIGLDALGTQVMALIVLYAFKHGTDLYMSAVLVISILSFVALVVWSKYIQQGNVVYPLKAPHKEKNSLHIEEGIWERTQAKDAEEKQKEVQKYE